MRRTLFRIRLPLALFILMIAVLLSASFSIIYSSFVAHSRGNRLRLETDYLDLDYPRGWFLIWGKEEINGSKYSILINPLYLRASMLIFVYDEEAAKIYLKKNGINDAFSSIMFEAERLYNWTLQKNENATMLFLRNETVNISNRRANSTTLILYGYVDNEGNYFNNVTWTLITYVDTRVFQFFYFGIENDYNTARDIFQEVLNSTKIK